MAKRPLHPEDAALVRKYADVLRQAVDDDRCPIIKSMKASTLDLVERAEEQKKELN